MRQNAGRDTSSLKTVFVEGPLSQVRTEDYKVEVEADHYRTEGEYSISSLVD
jgi:hypothetical protein